MRLTCLAILAATAALAAPPAPPARPAEEAAVVSANTAFATELYGVLAKQPGSLFFSPHSISTALAMTYGGARGKTAEEMALVLHFNKAEDLHRGFELLQKGLTADPKAPFQLAVANRLFAEKHFVFLDAFFALAKDRYGAPVELLDFRKATEASRVHINTWVEKQTNDRIKQLLPKGLLTPDTRLVLVNAIYFKGTWAQPFDPAATRDAPFDTGDKKVPAKLMFAKTVAALGEVEGGQVLELPYKGGALSMVVLLPKDAKGLAALEQKLTPKALDQWLSTARRQKVLVSLPKFKLESEFSLNEALVGLGMKSAFDCEPPTDVDFSGMTGKKDLCISAVVHKAFVEVNELGTEAAAATAVVMAEITSVEPPTPEFRADHPFLFAIRDVRSGALLFVGRLTDPSK